ncbi:hypothetical protein [Salinimicrobium soli]
MSIKQLAKEDEDFKQEYLATKESIFTISMVIIAVSALLILAISFFG